MNHPTITRLILVSAIAAGCPVSAQDTKPEISAKTTAYQTSVSQEQLRGATRRLKTEMIGLLEEFGQYQTATGELTKLKDALGQLDTVTDQDMVAVVRILREASRMEKAEDTKSKLIEASGGQKEIQSLLRSIADRLTLQKEEAEIQQRLDQLALRQMANLRDTKVMAESGSKPEKVKWELQKTQQVNQAEQDALKKEVGLAMDALKNLAEKSDSPAREAFEEALKTGEENLIRTQADQSTEKLKSDFAEAAKAQEELLKNLQKMAQGLQSRKSAEDQSRELAEKMDQLSTKQEQLADQLRSAYGDEKQAVRKEQEKIADQLELTKETLEKLNPEAAAKAGEARQEAGEVAEQLRDRKAIDKIDAVAKASDAQDAVAEKLDEVSDMLQKQADALAGNESQQSEAGESEMSAQQQAISDAVSQVMEAKSQMALAKRQLQDGGDQVDAKQRLDQAQGKLEQAEKEVAEAGGVVPPSVTENLQKAEESAAAAEEGVGVGSKQDQEKSRWSIDRAQQHADRALAGLQQAANQIASQQGQQGKSQQAGNQSQQGKEAGKSQSDPGGPAGGMMGSSKESSNVSAVSKAGEGRREALSLLQQEKAPTEYETMVQQYIRNLAEAADQE